MIFIDLIKGIPLNRLSITNSKDVNDETVGRLIKKAMDGEIDGIAEVVYYVMDVEFAGTYIVEFIDQFNNVIGSQNPELILTILSTDLTKRSITLSTSSGIRIDISI